jgi:hypothetical protein
MLPLTYRERRAIHKAKDGSAGARLRELAEHSMDVGESQTLSHAWNAVRLRNPKLFSAYIAETSESANHEETPMSSTADTLLAKARALVDAGASPDIAKALEAVAKESPALYLQHMREASQRPRSVRKDESAALPDRVAPRRTEAHEEIDRLCAKEQARFPGLSDADALTRVLASPRGRQLQREHEWQHYARAPR